MNTDKWLFRCSARANQRNNGICNFFREKASCSKLNSFLYLRRYGVPDEGIAPVLGDPHVLVQRNASILSSRQVVGGKQFIGARFGKGTQGVRIGIGLMDCWRPEVRNFQGGELVIPATHPGAASGLSN